jgi:hypothetical protein
MLGYHFRCLIEVSVSAGGLPIGALLVTDRVAEVMKPGDHGSTFAGNPLVCHAAEAVLDIISQPSFLQGVTQRGERLRAGLREGLKNNPHVKEVRGVGLICGVQLDQVCLACTLSLCAGFGGYPLGCVFVGSSPHQHLIDVLETLFFFFFFFFFFAVGPLFGMGRIVPLSVVD